MAKSYLSDEQVEQEIKRLNADPNVKLAKREERIKNKRRLHLYRLRAYEKRGKELADSGITYENIGEVLFGDTELDEE